MDENPYKAPENAGSRLPSSRFQLKYVPLVVGAIGVALLLLKLGLLFIELVVALFREHAA